MGSDQRLALARLAQHLYNCSRVVSLFLGFAYGQGCPPSFGNLADFSGEVSDGYFQASAALQFPEALFRELSASTAPLRGSGRPDPCHRGPYHPAIQGHEPSADCCISGPSFFDASFLCDSEDEELAGIVEQCLSSPKCPSASGASRPRPKPGRPLPPSVGHQAPTRKARTQQWRARVANSNKKFWAEHRKGLWGPSPAPGALATFSSDPDANACSSLEQGANPATQPPAEPQVQGLGSCRPSSGGAPGSRARGVGDFPVGRLGGCGWRGNVGSPLPRRRHPRLPRRLQACDNPAALAARQLASALRLHKAWEPCEALALEFAEAVEGFEESSLPYRVAYESLEAIQGDSWLDVDLAAAFLDDLVPQLSFDSPAEDLRFVSANITSWSREIFKWHHPDQGPLLIQELHLGDDGTARLRIEALARGYHLFLPPTDGPRPTQGGLATLVPIHCQGRYRGAGFVLVEMPRVRFSLLIANIYLRPGIGVTGGPNPEVLARLLPLLKQGVNWVVVGDWNVTPTELADCALPQTVWGKVVAPDEATIATGNCLDFALASSRLAPLFSAR